MGDALVAYPVHDLAAEFVRSQINWIASNHSLYTKGVIALWGGINLGRYPIYPFYPQFVNSFKCIFSTIEKAF